MKFKASILCVLLLLLSLTVKSQNSSLGKVSLSELNQKVHPQDSTAAAAILCKKGRTYFTYNEKTGFITNHEVQIRIKIYKKEGLKWANYEVPYYVGYKNINDDMLSFSDGMTYNLENGNIVKTKLNSEGSFKEKVNENWKKATITMPNVKVGSVIEFKYTIKTENIVKFPVFDMQYSIPVNYVEYITEIPGFYTYKPLLIGYVDVKSDAKVVDGSQSFSNEYGQSRSINYQQLNSKFVAENVPAIVQENFVDNMNNYKGAVQYELEKIKYPDEPVKDYSNTWEGVAKTIYADKNFGKEFEDQLYLLEDLKKIIVKLEAEPSELNKMISVFKFIQQKMNWNGEFGYYSDKGVKQAYLSQTGNVADVNFNLINMLRLAGVAANPVLVSTREHGIPVFPNRTVFNYVIVAVDINGERILLDATNKFTTCNVLPLNVLNWNGRLIKKDETSEEINLVPNKPSKQNHNLIVAIAKDGKISGKYLVQKTDYEALIFRTREADVKTDNYLEKKENEFNGIEISDYIIENKNTDLSKAVIEKFTFATNNHCEIIGGKLFINPLLFFTMNKNPFVQEKRKMPIYFGYPKQEKYNLSFEIPEGYEVESIPKAMRIATDDKSLVFSVNSIVQGNNIQISVAKEINVGMASADFYDGLKSFYQKMIEKQHEKIVLKKI